MVGHTDKAEYIQERINELAHHTESQEIVAYLIVSVGGDVTAEQQIPLHYGANLIGGTIGSSVVLRGRGVSTFHAILQLEQGFAFLEDLHSTNGTMIANQDGKEHKLIPRRLYQLLNGQRLTFGPTQCLLKLLANTQSTNNECKNAEIDKDDASRLLEVVSEKENQPMRQSLSEVDRTVQIEKKQGLEEKVDDGAAIPLDAPVVEERDIDVDSVHEAGDGADEGETTEKNDANSLASLIPAKRSIKEKVESVKMVKMGDNQVDDDPSTEVLAPSNSSSIVRDQDENRSPSSKLLAPGIKKVIKKPSKINLGPSTVNQTTRPIRIKKALVSTQEQAASYINNQVGKDGDSPVVTLPSRSKKRKTNAVSENVELSQICTKKVEEYQEEKEQEQERQQSKLEKEHSHIINDDESVTECSSAILSPAKDAIQIAEEVKSTSKRRRKKQTQKPRQTDKPKHSLKKGGTKVLKTVLDADIKFDEILLLPPARSASINRNSRSSLTTNTFRILVSSSGQDAENLKKAIKKIGGQCVDTPEACTHFVTDKVKRTVKFLCCLSLGKYIVTPEWLWESQRKKSFQDASLFPVIDREGEKKFGFSLQDSLDITLARKQPQFLENYLVYSTLSVIPGPEDLRKIVASAGGLLLLELKERASKQKKILVIGHEDDPVERTRLEKLGHKIYNIDLILNGILRQKLDLESFRLFE